MTEVNNIKTKTINGLAIPAIFFLLYKIILDLSYYLIIPNSKYYGLLGMNLNGIKLIESYFLASIIFILMPKSIKRLSNILIWLLILMSYIPMLTIFSFKDGSRIFMYAITIFWLCVFFLHVYASPPRIIRIKKSQAKLIYLVIFTTLTALSLFAIFKYLKGPLIFDIAEKVYNARFRFIDANLFFHGYFLHWLAIVFNPVFFVIYVIRKKWIYAGLIVILQLLVASNVGQRSYFFILPVALGLAWVVNHKNQLILITSGFILILLAGIISNYYIGDYIYTFIVGRLMLVPAQISFFYYDFFSTHQLIPLAYILKFFFHTFYPWSYPYSLDPAYLIGATYYKQPTVWAAGGMIPDAYMNFGFAGLFLLVIIFTLILKFFDACSRGIDKRIAIATITIPAISFASNYLIRSLITNGVLLSLLLLYLLPRVKTGDNLPFKNFQQN